MAMPKVVVETQWPQPVPRGRLLDVISVLPQTLPGDDGLKWLNGVTWNPKPCRGLLTSNADPCNADALDYSEDPADYFGCTDAVEQLSFQMYEVYRASPLQGWTLESIESEQRPHMDLIRSWAFARELMTGTASGGGHSLVSEATAATAPPGVAIGTAVTTTLKAIALLEDELARRLRGGRGIIHIPPGLLSFALGSGAIVEEDGQYQSAAGHLVVSDAGYVDAPPPTAGGGASGAGEDWIYASGPVWYRSTEAKIINTDANQGTDIERDQLSQFLASRGILVFDPCPVTAILATYA